MERLFITERLSYIPASSPPLSADVGIIEGDRFLYLFDVGACAKVKAFLEGLPKEKKVVLSHFHPDHMGNLADLTWGALYVGEHTVRYVEKVYGKGLPEGCLAVKEPVTITDGITLRIIPLPSSHAKGSLALSVDDTYLFLGDATYCTSKNGRVVYNAQLLKAQIDILRAEPAKLVLLSHAEPFVQEKEKVLGELEAIYAGRKEKEPYIEVEEA